MQVISSLVLGAAGKPQSSVFQVVVSITTSALVLCDLHWRPECVRSCGCHSHPGLLHLRHVLMSSYSYILVCSHVFVTYK